MKTSKRKFLIVISVCIAVIVILIGSACVFYVNTFTTLNEMIMVANYENVKYPDVDVWPNDIISNEDCAKLNLFSDYLHTENESVRFNASYKIVSFKYNKIVYLCNITCTLRDYSTWKIIETRNKSVIVSLEFLDNRWRITSVQDSNEV